MIPEISTNKYEIVIKEAESVPAGSGGIIFVPSFVKETGPTKKYGIEGAILGLTLRTTKSQIIRVIFKGLSFQLAQALQILEREKRTGINEIHVVGGIEKSSLEPDKS